jgi:hypothetical protein
LPTGLEIKVQPKACKGGVLSTLIVSYIVQLLQVVGFKETKREMWKDMIVHNTLAEIFTASWSIPAITVSSEISIG